MMGNGGSPDPTRTRGLTVLSALLGLQPLSCLGRQHTQLGRHRILGRPHRTPVPPGRPRRWRHSGGRTGWGQGGDQSSPSWGGRQAQGFPGRQGQGNPLPASRSRQGPTAAAGGGGGLTQEGLPAGELGGRKQRRSPGFSAPGREKVSCTDAPETGWNHSLLYRPGIP